MEDIYRVFWMDFLVPLALYHVNCNSTLSIQLIRVLIASSLVPLTTVNNP